MAFRLEAQLREPVVEWLRADRYDVRNEVSVFGRRADVVGLRDGRIVAVEMKLHDWSAALRQAIAYQIVADEAWVAMPLAAACRAYRHRWRFEAEAVGLLAVDDAGGVRTPILAKPSPRALPFASEALIRAAFSPASMEAVFSKEETGLQAF